MANIEKIAQGGDWGHSDHVFVALFIETGKVTPAAQQAYGVRDPIKASRMGNAFLKANRSVMDLVLERQGITLATLAKPIADALVANKRTYAKHQGAILDHADDVDHTTRLNASKLGYELIGEINRHKQRRDDDEAAMSTGPVILPVRPGMELPPTAQILEGEFDEHITEGGMQGRKGGGVEDVVDHNARTPSGDDKIDSVEGLSEKKSDLGEKDNEEDW